MVKTRLLIISDTHSETRNNAAYQAINSTNAFCPPFPKADVVLHTGDLTMIGSPRENAAALNFVANMDAELKLVIAGNHDLTLDKDYYQHSREARTLTSMAKQSHSPQWADTVRKMWTSTAPAGVRYLDEGTHAFTLGNGARLVVYASPWQPEFCKWAFNYSHEEDRWNPRELVRPVPFAKAGSAHTIVRPPDGDYSPIPREGVDVVMTHGPPWMHLDWCAPDGARAGCPQLLQALERTRPRLHCFGHIHEAWGAERLTWKPRGDGQEPERLAELGARGEIEEKTEVLGLTMVEKSQLPQWARKRVQTQVDRDVVERRAAYLDLSGSSSQPLRVGEETMLINSSIMNLEYTPENAAWLVDLELPMSSETSKALGDLELPKSSEASEALGAWGTSGRGFCPG